MQQPNSNAKATAFRNKLPTIIADTHEATLAKFGAILAQGIMEAGGRNVTIRVCRDFGHMDASSVAGLFIFTQVKGFLARSKSQLDVYSTLLTSRFPPFFSRLSSGSGSR